MTSPADAFHDQFFALSSDDAESFVADLWRARGWSVERSQGRLVARQADGAPVKTLYVLGARRGNSPPLDTPAVVLRTDPAGPGRTERVRVLESGDLYEMVQFGVDRESARELQAAYFDAIPLETAAAADARKRTDGRQTASSATAAQSAETDDSMTAGESSRGGPANDASAAEPRSPKHSKDASAAGTDGQMDGRVNRRRLLVAGGALLAGVGAVLVAGVDTNGDSTPLPPGLTGEGVVDAEALARGHVEALSDVSYSLAFDQVVTAVDKSLRSYISMDLALAADRTYRSHVGTAGPEAPGLLGEPPASAIYWSDGERFLVRFSPEETQRFSEFRPPDNYIASWHYWAGMIPFGGTIGSRPEKYFETVFDALPTRLVERPTRDGGTHYRVTNDGRSTRAPSSLGEPYASNPRDVRLHAIVDPRGIVRSFELRFSAMMDDAPVEIDKTLNYTAIGETTVSSPTSVS